MIAIAGLNGDVTSWAQPSHTIGVIYVIIYSSELGEKQTTENSSRKRVQCAAFVA